jgi:hypothetical protein
LFLTLGLVDFDNFERITYYGASALTVSIAAITLSKISFGVTLLRLTEGWLKAYVRFAIATLAIFAIPAAVLPWVLCKPLTKTFVDILPGTCIDKQPSVQYGRFQAGPYYDADMMHHDVLADARRSMGCAHGFLSRIDALEDHLEPADAVCGEDWCRCCYEFGYLVSFTYHILP